MTYDELMAQGHAKDLDGNTMPEETFDKFKKQGWFDLPATDDPGYGIAMDAVIRNVYLEHKGGWTHLPPDEQKKKDADYREVVVETERKMAKLLYDSAKERFVEERLRHEIVVAGFTEEKERLGAEIALHASIVAGFAEDKLKHKAEIERHRVAMAGFAAEKATHKDEKARHQQVMDSFSDTKAMQKAERDRHQCALKQYQKDVERHRGYTRQDRADEVEFDRLQAEQIEIDLAAYHAAHTRAPATQ